MGLEWIEWVVDVISRRDGPENFRILRSSYSTFEASSWVFKICFEEISLGLDRQKWVEILDSTRFAVPG